MNLLHTYFVFCLGMTLMWSLFALVGCGFSFCACGFRDNTCFFWVREGGRVRGSFPEKGCSTFFSIRLHLFVIVFVSLERCGCINPRPTLPHPFHLVMTAVFTFLQIDVIEDRCILFCKWDLSNWRMWCKNYTLGASLSKVLWQLWQSLSSNVV